MEHALDPAHRVQHGGGIGHVGFDDLERGVAGVLREIAPMAASEVVDRPDLAPARDERVHQMGADEPGAAGDEVEAHALTPLPAASSTGPGTCGRCAAAFPASRCAAARPTAYPH